MAQDLEQTHTDIRKVAILEPDLHVEIKYYRTDVYIYSQSESDTMTHLFKKSLKEVFTEKGYKASHVPASSLSEFANAQAAAAADRVTWRGSSTLSMPSGMERGPKNYQGEAYVRLLRRAEQILIQVITLDPGYDSEVLPERLFFFSPEAEFAEYDMVVISYGMMREETRSENRARWIRNLTINAAMLPVTLGSFIFPFALPITLNMPHFIDTNPDISWIAMIAFDPRNGEVLFVNEFSYEQGKTRNAVRRGAEMLLEKFPEKTP